MTLKGRIGALKAYNPTLDFGKTNEDAFKALFTICYNASAPKYSGAARYLYRNFKRITFNPASNQVGFTSRQSNKASNHRRNPICSITFYRKDTNDSWTITVDLGDEPIQYIKGVSTIDQPPVIDEDWVRRIQWLASKPLPKSNLELFNYLLQACTKYYRLSRPRGDGEGTDELNISKFISEEIEYVFYDPKVDFIHFSPKSPAMRLKEIDGFREIFFDPDIRDANSDIHLLRIDEDGRYLTIDKRTICKLPHIENESGDEDER